MDRLTIESKMPLTINSAAILISGAASGLGFAFLQHYATMNHDQIIIAVDQYQIQLTEEFCNPDRIKIFILNVTDIESIESLSKSLDKIPIGLIIHCAGVRGLVPSIVKKQ